MVMLKTKTVEAEYSIGELVDLDKLRTTFEKFHQATGFTVGFLDHPGLNILIAAGWRDICTKFHRSSPVAAENCLKSNRGLLNSLDRAGETVIEMCDNGLVDCATPIIIKGKHIASLATGQLLLQEPDLERFKKQAALYGFDEGEYLSALKEIPVVPEEKVRCVTAYLGELALWITEQGYAALELKEKNEQLEAVMASKEASETALKASEEKYRVLFEHSTTAVFLTDVETETILDANKKAERLTGRTRGELIGMNRLKLHPQDQAEFYMQHFQDHVAESGAAASVAFIERKDGARVPVLITATVMQLGGRKVIQGVFEDISERIRLENALKSSEQKFRDLTETTPDCIWETDTNWEYTYISPRAKELIGYGPEELTGKTPFEHMQFRDKQRLIDIFEDCYAQQKPFQNLETVYQHKDGRHIAVEISGNPYFSEEGELIGYRGVHRDISLRRQLEEQESLKALLLDSVKDCVLLLDRSGRICYANEVTYTHRGYSEDELMGMNFKELLSPEGAEKLDGHIEKALRTGEVLFEADHLFKGREDGSDGNPRAQRGNGGGGVPIVRVTRLDRAETL